MAQHLYLGATCKNPICSTLCTLKYLGVDIGQRMTAKLEFDGIQHECVDCHWEYQYKPNDLRPIRLPDPPQPGWTSSF
jgi:hypothetical protein